MLGALQSPQPPPTDVLLTALLNDLTALGAVVLVLDDYHVIESQPIDEALTFFVDHLPPQLRLVIATREDPPLPLARLRARGQLTELRASDLRFTPSEAADFLNEVMGLNLSARRRCRAGDAHRGLDCRTAIGRAVHARPIGHRQFHSGVHGQSSLCAGLLDGRSLAAPA